MLDRGNAVMKSVNVKSRKLKRLYKFEYAKRYLENSNLLHISIYKYTYIHINMGGRFEGVFRFEFGDDC